MADAVKATVMGEERLAQGIGHVRDVDVDHNGAVLILTHAANGRLVRMYTD